MRAAQRRDATARFQLLEAGGVRRDDDVVAQSHLDADRVGVPCTTAITGLVQRRCKPKGSTSPGLRRSGSAVGPKKRGMSSPAVVCSPTEQKIATHRSSLSSYSVSSSASRSRIAGV